MGADYDGQEKAIVEISGLSGTARDYIAHHLRNSMQTISLSLDLLGRDISDPAMREANINRLAVIGDALIHIQQDLEKIGC